MSSDNNDDIPEGAPLPPVIPLDPEVEELWSSRALLLVLLLLILSFWVSYYLKVRRIKSIHETIVALIAGGVVGLIVRLSPGTVVQGMISFKHTILLNVLLPPIILNSGFELRQANFFRNFGVILVFAFAGTFISAVVLGVLVYIWALLGLEGLSLSIVECLIFGSTLSATDPVTILAIFNALKVDPKLYSIIFGESILNDAVAIVMFETLSQFHGEKVHILSFFHGVGIFLLIFLTSMALGVVFGLACSLMLKHSRLNEYPEIESCLIILIAYTSYFFSNGLTMSGIVSLLFCGITLKHYAYHNMSRRSQRTSKYIFASLAQLSENFIFIYLGLSLFTQTDLVYKPIFILVTALACVAARWCAVFPISKVINLFFKGRGMRNEELPQSYQTMLFWSGLRGAVGVALAAGIKGHNAKSLRTTVLVTVVITLVVFGGTVSKMIEIVGIRTGVEEDDESSDEEGPLVGSMAGYRATGSQDSPYRDYRNESAASLHGSNGKRYPTYRMNSHDNVDSDEEDNEVLPSASSGGFGETSADGDDGAVWRDGQWFNVLDERYLLPVFSNATASRRQANRKAMRSTARLGAYNNEGSHEHSPERDLSSRPEPLRSPWGDNNGTSSNNPAGRRSPETRSGNGGGGNGSGGPASGNGHGRTNSRGWVAVRDQQHTQTPSLSVAVSSLFSSLASSSPRPVGGHSGPAATLPTGSASNPAHTSFDGTVPLSSVTVTPARSRGSTPHPANFSVGEDDTGRSRSTPHHNPFAASMHSFGLPQPATGSASNIFATPGKRRNSGASLLPEASSDVGQLPTASTPGGSLASSTERPYAHSVDLGRGTAAALAISRQAAEAALYRRQSASSGNLPLSAPQGQRRNTAGGSQGDRHASGRA